MTHLEICNKIALPNETWKQLPEEPLYYVSDLGRVASFRHCGNLRIPKMFNNNRSLQVNINGISKQVHRLVMQTFVGESKMFVLHKDRDYMNNTLANLEYIAKQEIKVKVRNTDAIVGVSYEYKLRQPKKYKARIRVNNKPIHLGVFLTAKEASEMYQQALAIVKDDSVADKVAAIKRLKNKK